jgi:hypothetical protein
MKRTHSPNQGLGLPDSPPLQARYYDFNVHTRKKWIEKLPG